MVITRIESIPLPVDIESTYTCSGIEGIVDVTRPIKLSGQKVIKISAKRPKNRSRRRSNRIMRIIRHNTRDIQVAGVRVGNPITLIVVWSLMTTFRSRDSAARRTISVSHRRHGAL